MDDLESLIFKAQRGEKEAFGSIYQLFYKRIFRFCRSYLPDDQLAADFCQETFIKAWRALPNFSLQKGGSFQAFLFRIARNLLIDRSRKKKEYSLEQEEEIEEKTDLETELEQKDEQIKLRSCLQKLSETDRQIIVLRFFEDLSFIEVAKVTGIKEGALRVKTHRALKKLKEILENG